MGSSRKDDLEKFDADQARIHLTLAKLKLIPSRHLSLFGYPALLQLVTMALDAARNRRERLVNMVATPEPSLARVGGKRKELPKRGEQTPSTVASSSKVDKVTPDPKHVRTNEAAAPTPKELFASPRVEQPDVNMKDTSGSHEGLVGLFFFTHDGRLGYHKYIYIYFLMFIVP